MPDPIRETVELIHDAKCGDKIAMQELVERYGPRLLARVRVLMGPQARALAESRDFLQSVFAEVIGGLSRFEVRNEDAFLRWVTQIARNKVRGSVRKKREDALIELGSEILGAHDAETPSVEVSRLEQVHRLVNALEQLPEEQQVVIELRHFERMSFSQIGARLGKSENAAQLAHARALMRLGRLLARQ